MEQGHGVLVITLLKILLLVLLIVRYLIQITHKNTFFVLGEGPTYDITGGRGPAEKTSSIHFIKTKLKFCLSQHCNADNSYLLVNGNEIYKFEANNKISNFPN